MPELDFYANNDRIFYPLKIFADLTFTPSGALPLKGLVDAGFMMGIDAEFDDELHGVFLASVTLNNGLQELTFEFTSDAPGMAGYHWLFVFPYTASSGCSAQVDATSIGPEVADEHVGWGFLTVGRIDEILALADGLHTLANPPQVEEGLVQNLNKTYVRSLNLANDARRCPPQCCEAPVVPTENTFAVAGGTGLIGDLRFIPGFNSTIAVDESGNAIEFGAIKGGGEGEPCKDIVIDEDGLRYDPDESDEPVCEACDQYIRSLNGRHANETGGRLRISGGDQVEITTAPAKLTFKFKSYGG